MKSEKGRIFLVLMMFALTACISTTCFMSEAFAGNDKTRVNVGWSIDEAIETLVPDSTWEISTMGCMWWQCVYSQLWMMGTPPEYDPVGVLADKWEKLDDGFVWRWHLNKNAKFHDGTPVTARDVLYSIENLPDVDPVWWWTDAITAKKKNKIIDDHTLEIKLKERHAHPKYPAVAYKPILPKHIWEKYEGKWFDYDNAEAIGSGPWKLKEFKEGEFLWFERFNDYFGEKPGFDEMVWRMYGTFDAQILALKSGEIDFVGYSYGVPVSKVPEFKKDPKFDVIDSVGLGVSWLVFNYFAGDNMTNLKFRQAVMHSINKERLAMIAYQGDGFSVDSFTYIDDPEHNPNLNQYEYNLEKAKQLFKEAGYADTDGDGIVNDPKTKQNMKQLRMMITADWVDEVKLMRMVIEMLKEVGVPAVLLALDEDTYFQFIFGPEEKKFDIAYMGEEPGPYGLWMHEYAYGYFHGGKGWNPSGYDNPKFDETFDVLAAESDPAKRKALVYELQRIVNEDLPYGFLLGYTQTDVVRKDHVKDYVVSMGGLSNWINLWTMFNVKPAN